MRWILPATTPNYAKRRSATWTGSLPYEAACWILRISGRVGVRYAMAAVHGADSRGFILITAIEGVRYAVRHAVVVIQVRTSATMSPWCALHSGAIVQVPCTMDEALAWFEQIGETLT